MTTKKTANFNIQDLATVADIATENMVMQQELNSLRQKSTIEKTVEKQIFDLTEENIKLRKEIDMLNKENDENKKWRDAVTNALMDNMGVDIDLETAVGEINAMKKQCREYECRLEETVEQLEDSVEYLRNSKPQETGEKESENTTQYLESYRKQLMYAEDWRDAVTDALLDSVGFTISHQRAIEIINDLKKRANEKQESVLNNTQKTTQNINYDEVIKFLTNCSAQKDELDRLNKQCAYFRREIKTMEDRIENVRKGVEDGRCQLVLSFKKD